MCRCVQHNFLLIDILILVLTSDREIAKVLIDKLMIPEGYDPSNYPNPCKFYLLFHFILSLSKTLIFIFLDLRNHKNIIQAIALDTEEGIEKVTDNSVPKYDFIESVCCVTLQNSLDLFYFFSFHFPR